MSHRPVARHRHSRVVPLHPRSSAQVHDRGPAKWLVLAYANLELM